MKRILIISSVSAAIATSSCGVYRQYETSQPDIVDSLYVEMPNGVGIDDSCSLGKLSWRELFTDPRLQQLIETALDNNTDLKVARLRVKSAEESLTASRLAFLPSVSLDANGRLSSTDGSKPTKTYSIGPCASWEIDIFGKNLNDMRSKLAALEYQKAYSQAVTTGLISSVAESYYTLLMLDRQLAISQRTLYNWDENIRTLTVMKRAGRSNEAAVLQAKANRMNVEANIVNLEERIEQQSLSICSLLGISPQKIERGEISSVKFPDEFAIGLPLELLNNRPDVRQAEMELAQAYYATNIARSAFYPTLTLSGSAGWTNSGAAVSNPGSWLLSAIGNIVQPIFNRGTNRANLKISQNRQEEARLRFRQTLLDAGMEVNSSLISWQNSRRSLEVDAERITTLLKAVDKTKMLMKHGKANYLEVLTAQQNLLSAELSGVEDKYSEIYSVISLYHALGGGK